MKFKISVFVIVSIITVLFTVSVVSAAEGFTTLREKITNLQERLASAGVEVDLSGLDDTQAEQVINKAVTEYIAERDAQAAVDRAAIEATIQEDQVSVLKAKLADVGIEVNTDGLGAEEAYMKMRAAYNEYISQLQTNPPIDEQSLLNSSNSPNEAPSFNTEEYIQILQKKLRSVGIEVNTDGLSTEETLIALRTAYNDYISTSDSQ